MHEEQETKELRSMVQVLSERVSNETVRADTAEARAKDAVLRFKQVNDARLAALQEAARLHEELELYKLQLDNAQREIRRAQELLDALEAQRFDAEEAAARARSMARKLKEEKLMQLAHDEGRLEGMKEGITRGRIIGYEEGRSAVYVRRAATGQEFGQGNTTPPDDPPIRSFRMPDFAPPGSDSTDQERQQPDSRGPPPEKIVVHSPRTQPLRQSPPQSPDPVIHPVPMYTVPASPQHEPVDYPPEGWIPTIDSDQRIRLPPPHELSPAPYTPPNLPPSTPDQPMLMIPPPSRRATVETVTDDDSVTGAEAARPRVRRRKSSDSQSTTFSQFDIIAPPTALSARANSIHRPNVLSAIVEERTPAPVSVAIMFLVHR